MPTGIEWCDETWNPLTGCTPISRGCENCWARRQSQRMKGRFGYDEHQPFKPGTVHADQMSHPKPWQMQSPRRIFVCSMGDLFHDAVNTIDIAAVFGIMEKAPHHRFLILTKRPERMANFLAWRYQKLRIPEHLWCGVSIEDQRAGNERIPWLARVNGHRFLSIEPLLEPIDLCRWYIDRQPPIEWVIVGGETGHGARPMQAQWARTIRDFCAGRVPYFFKHMGTAGGPVEAPPDLISFRQFPPELDLKGA